MVLWRDKVVYRGLPEFGLPFITVEDSRFDELKSQVVFHPLAGRPEASPPETVIVVNESRQPVLAMSFLWRWTDGSGQVTTTRMSGVSSLSQLGPVQGDPRQLRFHPFLPGSKRLVTAAGVFGDNSDVLPASSERSGFMGGFGGTSLRGRRGVKDPERHLLEMQLDSAIFADGLCAGPDELGVLAALEPVRTEQQRIASEAAVLLRSGANFGEVFDCLRFAARRPGPTSTLQNTDPSHLLFTFGTQAMDRLIHAQDEQRDGLTAWFEEQSRQPMLKLRRP
jgi:hypothetical protein